MSSFAANQATSKNQWFVSRSHVSKERAGVNNHRSVGYVVYMAEPMTAIPCNVK